MNIHKIDSHLHQSFLEEERKDAITGDLIQANDEVVFCGTCKSAFLKDSWEYIGQKHCGQAKTLASVPISVPLLLNVSIIKPHFITLTNSSISFEKCLKMLSDFNPKSKKITIALEEEFEKGTDSYQNMMIQPTKIENSLIKQPKNKKAKSYNQIETNSKIFGLVILSVVSFFMIALFYETVLGIEKIIAGFFILLLIYLFAFGKISSFFDKIGITKREENHSLLGKNSTSLENQDSVTFGLFNHNLFFYFEEQQQGIFIDFTRIKSIEIKYKAKNYFYLSLKKIQKENSKVEIPLIFSRKEELTTFLLKLAKTKKDISNQSKIILIDFPNERENFLKKKLIHYNEFVFTETYISPPKKTPKNVVLSLEEIIVQAKEFQNLTESQKKSKQSQNRNHYQNRSQTQYKNYKRK